MKKTLIVIAFAVVLVIGFVLASTNFIGESIQEESNSGTCTGAPLTCGAETCNNQCGGNCGIPSCGCS